MATSYIDFDSDKTVGIRVNGKISDQEFNNIAATLERRMQDNPKVNMYTEIESFGGMEPETFFKDLKFGIKHWDRFDKEAIVTDKEWLQKIGPAAGKLFPGIDVKAFTFDEKGQAREWIQQ